MTHLSSGNINLRMLHLKEVSYFWMLSVVCQEFRPVGVFGELFEASAHARIAEMEHSGVRPCRENGNNLKLVVN